jgi:aminocarboxymuconate-semialdehyde decarboxylase
VVFSAQQLAALIDMFGDDNVLIGTDYPFDMAEADPLGHVASIPKLSDATRAAIAGGNAKRLLGL